MRLLLATILIFFAPLAHAQALPEPETPAAWRALALRDLEAIRDRLEADSPIAVDTENPELRTWWRDGYTASRSLAERVTDRSGWFYALNAYVNGFRDPHVKLNSNTSLPPARWPGFVAAPRGDSAVISWRADDGPPMGAEIVSCDGKALAALQEERVFPYTLNPRIALDRRRAVLRLFLDRQVPFAPLTSSCVFRIDGREETRALSWRALPDPAEPYWAAYGAASAGPAAGWGVSEPTQGVFWIGIPTFSSGEDTAPSLKALVEQISAQASTMRAGQAIVIDIRGNGGGNTAWSNRIIEALLPPELLRRHAPPSGRSAVEWRVSAANIADFEEFLAQAKAEFGENSNDVRHIQEVIEGMRKAQARGHALWRHGSRVTGAGGGLTARRPSGASPIPARIFVLGNGTCASTCLDFLDRILFIPGVKLVGSDSGADTNMMEVRAVALPSGLATLTLPQKVYRGRARGSMEAYKADIAYDGEWGDTAVRAWTMSVVASR